MLTVILKVVWLKSRLKRVAGRHERIQLEVSLVLLSTNLSFFLFLFSSSKFKDLLQRKAYFIIMQDEPRLTLKMSSPYPLILTLICPFSLSVCLSVCRMSRSLSLSVSLSHTQLAHLHDSCSYGNREITFKF